MEITIVLLLVFQIVRWVMNRRRFRELEDRIEGLSVGHPEVQDQIRALTIRLYQLESKGTAAPAFVVASPVAPPPLPVMEDPVVVPEPEPAPQPAFVPAAPRGPTLAERLRAALGGEEWEALVGGSLLNKIGALVLVVGIALLIVYGFTQVSPAGRAVISLALSVGILGAGVWVERSVKYRIFARGLIGAGWAALYVTAYAVYAIPAARVIENPFVGAVGVLLVAAGMIGHSLLYRSQSLTAVAYFTAFAALGVTPSTPFAVIVLIPLAGSLLYLARRFDWHGMALFGLFATYGTCISRGSSDASVYSSETLFLVYWVLFEAFDLLRTQRRIVAAGLGMVAPLNALGFLGLSYFTWAVKAPDQMWLMTAFASALYLGSALVRAVLRPEKSFGPADDLVARVEAGGYEFSLLLSAVLAGLAIVAHVPGVWMGVGLAIEAELLYAAGVRWNSGVLRRLGITAFLFSLGRIFEFDYPAGGHTPVLGHLMRNWTPPVLMHAVLFYLNRAIRRPNRTFGFAASALVAWVIGGEVDSEFLGMAWILFAALLFELGVRRKLIEFRIQGYLLACWGIGFLLLSHGIFQPHDWVALAISMALVYGSAIRRRWIPEGTLPPLELGWMQRGASAGTAILAGLVLWNTVSEGYFGLSVCLLAVGFFELGLRGLPVPLRLTSYVVWVVGAFVVTLPDGGAAVKFSQSPLALSYGVGALTAWFLCARVSFQGLAIDNRFLRHGMALGGTLLALRGLWIVLPEPWVAVAWAAIALAWVELGLRLEAPPFRWVGHGVMAAVGIRLALVNFNYPRQTLTILPEIAAGYYLWYRMRPSFSARVYSWLAAIPALALLYSDLPGEGRLAGWAVFAFALQFLGRRIGDSDLEWQSYLVAAMTFVVAVGDPQDRWAAAAIIAAFFAGQGVAAGRARIFFSILATLLLTATLYHEISGRILTMAWGLEGVALLAVGFVGRERLLRLQGLVVFLACIVKLFAFDLQKLDRMYQILSFIALGLILLAVSWIYSRFRDILKRFL